MIDAATQERFWRKVDRRGDSACWPWMACKNRKGYGHFTLTGGKHIGAHRASFLIAGGEIPPGLTLDHLCRNPACVNPAHLEPVTTQENTLRGLSYPTHCKRGHLLAGENAKPRAGSEKQRACRQCGNLRTAKWRAKKKDASNG